MKRIFLAVALTMGLSFVGCDDRVSSPTAPNQKVVVSKKFSKTITVVTKKDSDIVIGRIVDRQSELGSPVVVCSQEMNVCSRTNSKGNYVLTPAKTIAISFLAARAYSETDTLTTPENFVPIIQNDTTFDTTSFLDTNIVSFDGVDSIIVTDSTVIIQNIVVVLSSPVNDTLSVISNGTILREVPIDSWGFILPTNYIVQRDISAEDATNDSLIRSIEAVYFITGDSVAKVIPLGRSNKFFSGFLYTFYDDSSFRKDTKIYNLFIRAKDSLGRIICITPIEHFSERFGDFDKKVLSVKTGLPEAKIVPKMIPAAKNNKNMKDAIREYLAQADTTINWVGIDNIQVTSSVDTNETGEKFYFFTQNKVVELMNMYDSVSVEVNTQNDSLYNMVQYTNSNKYIVPIKGQWVTYKFSLSGAKTVFFGFDTVENTAYRNIIFYLK